MKYARFMFIYLFLLDFEIRKPTGRSYRYSFTFNKDRRRDIPRQNKSIKRDRESVCESEREGGGRRNSEKQTF